MAVISGKSGTLLIDAAEVTPVSNWTLTTLSDNRAYAANDTAGWKRRAAGVRDCRGTFECKVTDSGSAPVEEGDSVSLKLQVDDTGSNYYTVPAIISKVEIECDIAGGEIVAWVIEFAGNGAVTRTGTVAKSGG